MSEEVRSLLHTAIEIKRREAFIPEYQDRATDAETLGIALAQYLGGGPAIIETAYSAFEEANLHDYNLTVKKWLTREQRRRVAEGTVYRERSRPPIADNREEGGRFVREAWVRWASRQQDPKPHHLIPWSELDEHNREADRCIWDDIVTPYADLVRRLVDENERLRKDKDQLADRILVLELKEGQS